MGEREKDWARCHFGVKHNHQKRLPRTRRRDACAASRVGGVTCGPSDKVVDFLARTFTERRCHKEFGMFAGLFPSLAKQFPEVGLAENAFLVESLP